MSEERFDRLESQLSQVIQGMGTMQQNIAGLQQGMTVMQQNMTVMQQTMATKQDLAAVEQKVSAMQNNLDAAREDIASLHRRVDSNEGTLIVAIRDGFRSRETLIDDINFDLAAIERKTRRLSRRVARLERIDRDDD
jgi:septal ring factor EnvC (AmiA/AmiB activator)